MDRDLRCKAEVWKRDTYRYSGRGSSGFTMHYTEEQCGRKRRESGLCWQHEREKAAGRNVRLTRFA